MEANELSDAELRAELARREEKAVVSARALQQELLVRVAEGQDWVNEILNDLAVLSALATSLKHPDVAIPVSAFISPDNLEFLKGIHKSTVSGTRKAPAKPAHAAFSWKETRKLSDVEILVKELNHKEHRYKVEASTTGNSLANAYYETEDLDDQGIGGLSNKLTAILKTIPRAGKR